MVDYRSEALTAVFHAMADPTRRGMLQALRAGERSISDLAAPLRMTLAGASKHLRALERARLVRREKRGRTHYCRLEAAPMAEADEWLGTYRRFWTERLDALEAELLKDADEDRKKRRPK
jgi:DNA-binding transcriptional ArsR family regulator